MKSAFQWLGFPSGRVIACYVAHYIYGLAASSFNAGIAALVGFFGAAGAAAANLPVKPLDLQQVKAIFVAAVLWHALAYFQKNKIPEDLPVPAAIAAGTPQKN